MRKNAKRFGASGGSRPNAVYARASTAEATSVGPNGRRLWRYDYAHHAPKTFASEVVAADLNREYDTARQAYNRGRLDYNRVRFAMMLSLPNTPFNDDGRALDVLEPIVRKGDGRLYPLAQLLGSQIQEQKRLNASVQGLQQKLDALKSLERSIIERSR